MNVLPSAAKTDNRASVAVKAVSPASTVAALEIEMDTSPVSIRFEKNRALTGPAGPSGAPARLPAATVSDENSELASVRIYSMTTLIAPACHTKKNPAPSALVSALIETGAPGQHVLQLAAMQSEHANEATLAILDLKTTLNPATCSPAATLFHGQNGQAAQLLASWVLALDRTLGHATTKLMSSRLKRAMPAMVITLSGPRGTSARKPALAVPSPASVSTPAASGTLVASLTSSLRPNLAARKASGQNTQNTRPAHRLVKAAL